MTDSSKIIDLLDRDIDDLYAEIGQQLFGTAAFPPSRKQLVEIAKKWLSDKRSELAELVCHEEIVIRLTSEDPTTQNRILLVSALADLIASLIHGISPVTVSVLLVKEGLTSLCKNIWQPKQ